MGDLVSQAQATDILPPRRGKVIALTVDTTARAYDLTTINLGDIYRPTATDKLYITLSANGGEIHYYFSDVTASDLSDTAAIAAGGTLAFATTYSGVVEDGARQYERIQRNVDKFIIVKSAAGTPILRIWASSPSTGIAP